MNITPETPSKSFVIAGLTMTVSEPFAEGHVLTENEAASMNQTFAENIRNNFAGKVADFLTTSARALGLIGAEESLTADAKTAVLNAVSAGEISTDELQAALDTYQSEYEFGARRSGGGARITDPIELEALSICRQMVRDALKKKGLSMKEVGADKINELAKGVLEQHPEIRERAKTIVETRKSAALETLDL
jgi:hypothetical protein